MNTKEESNISRTYSGQKELQRFYLTAKHKEVFYEYDHTNINSTFYKIEAELNKIDFLGNYFLPLIKNFMVYYHCYIKTNGLLNMGVNLKLLENAIKINGKIEGKIEGKISINIFGICSPHLAKKLDIDEMRKKIISILNKQIKAAIM